MAFAGDFGAAGNLIPFALCYSPVYGQATGYDANGNLQFTTPGGTVVTPARIDHLQITAGQNILAALVDNTDDGSAADTGVFVAAAAAANQHGLPVNFGPGRGNWGDGNPANDRARLRAFIDSAINTVAAVTNAGGPHVRVNGDTIAGGLTSIVIKNMSEVALASAVIDLQVQHSIQA